MYAKLVLCTLGLWFTCSSSIFYYFHFILLSLTARSLLSLFELHASGRADLGSEIGVRAAVTALFEETLPQLIEFALT